MEFLEDFDEFKGGMASKIGNLTCVMTELKMLTPELKVNIDYYTRSIEEDEEIDVTESEFLQDPEWMERLTTGYQDCYDISESIPSAALMSNPLTKVFGRQMIFFKCAKVDILYQLILKHDTYFQFCLEKRAHELRSGADEEVG